MQFLLPVPSREQIIFFSLLEYTCGPEALDWDSVGTRVIVDLAAEDDVTMVPKCKVGGLGIVDGRVISACCAEVFGVS